MINLDVLILSINYTWAWSTRDDCRFIEFCQLFQQVLTIVIDSFLMVAHVKPKVVKPSANSFTTYFYTKIITDSFAEHLSHEVWCTLPACICIFVQTVGNLHHEG